MVGYSIDASGHFLATLWNNSTPILLPTLASEVSSVAYSINELGQVVGSVIDANGKTFAVLWDGSSVVR